MVWGHLPRAFISEGWPARAVVDDTEVAQTALPVTLMLGVAGPIKRSKILTHDVPLNWPRQPRSFDKEGIAASLLQHGEPMDGLGTGIKVSSGGCGKESVPSQPLSLRSLRCPDVILVLVRIINAVRFALEGSLAQQGGYIQPCHRILQHGFDGGARTYFVGLRWRMSSRGTLGIHGAACRIQTQRFVEAGRRALVNGRGAPGPSLSPPIRKQGSLLEKTMGK